jgi:uncharacterized protein DUF4388/type II secretion system (T2SS) protein G
MSVALEGTIKDFGLADILQLIGIQRKTGVLSLDNGDETVILKFLDGHVVGADTKDRNLEHLLGSVLVRTGRITDAQLRNALRLQRETLQRLGYVLVRQRFISQEDLVDALRTQVTQIVYRLFRWRHGKYQFTPMDHVDYDTEHFQPLAAETILMEGARMIDEWPIIERRVRSGSMVFRQTEAGRALDVPVESLLDTDLDFGFHDSPEGRVEPRDKVRVSREERGILHMVDGRSTVQDIVDTSPLGEFDVYHTLYALLDRSLIEDAPLSKVASVAPAAATRSRWLGVTLVGAAWLLALFGAASLPDNAWTPWALVRSSSETDRLRTYASRNRIGRLERGIEIYYLDRGAVPERLEQLAEGGYVETVNLVDPWGRPYGYGSSATGYVIAPTGPDGSRRSDLEVRHRFTPSQRMLLEGGLSDRGPTAP